MDRVVAEKGEWVPGFRCHRALRAVCVIRVHMYVYMYVESRRKIHQHLRLASPKE